MKNMLIRLVQDDQGQDLVEYAMLVALIAIVCTIGVGAFGTAINGWFDGLAGQIPLT